MGTRHALAFVAALAAVTGLAGPAAGSTASTTSATAAAREVAPHRVTVPLRGAPAAPVSVSLTQPDGTAVAAVAQGDSAHHWYATPRGVSIARDAQGYWRVATRDASGALAPTGARADSTLATRAPARVTPRPTVTPSVELASASSSSFVGTGSQRVLVILAQFTDVAGTTSATDWGNRYFATATSSVADFYGKASTNKLVLSRAAESSGTANDGIVGWVTIPHTHPNFAGSLSGNSQTLAADAFAAADPYVNFAAYDTNGDGYVMPNELHVVVVAAGFETSYGGPSAMCGASIWGHRGGIANNVHDAKYIGWGGYMEFGEKDCVSSNPAGTHMATMGIMAHELGHDLGWPDLYDTDYTSSGVGSWSLMAAGSWGTTTYAGDTPSLPDAWSRASQGWVTPQVVSGTQGLTLAGGPNPAVAQVLANPGGFDWNWGRTAATGEYFLVENRQRTGYDASLPGCGLLVYHVDESQTSNADDSHRLVDVEEADGLGRLDTSTYDGSAADPWPGSANRTTFSSSTTPNSNLYSGAATPVALTVSGGCAASMPVTLTGPTPPVTPAAPTFRDACGSAKDVVVVPATAGVTYRVNGVATAAGTYAASGTVTVTAVPAAAGVTLAGTTTWTRTFVATACTENLTVPATSVPTWTTPKAVLSWSTTGTRYGALTHTVQRRTVTVSSTGVRVYGTPATWLTTTATSGTYTGSAATVVQFRAMAKDALGATTPWSAWKTLTLPTDDRSAAVTGTWTAGTSTSTYAGTWRQTTKAGSAATITAWTDQVRVVGTRSKATSKISVYVDGVLKGTVDTYAATAAVRQVLATYAVPYGKHTVKVVDLATAGRPTFVLDGFIFHR